MTATNYFIVRTPPDLPPIEGVFPFNDTQRDSISQAWQNAVALRNELKSQQTDTPPEPKHEAEEGQVEFITDLPIAVWRRPDMHGEWWLAQEVGVNHQ